MVGKISTCYRVRSNGGAGLSNFLSEHGRFLLHWLLYLPRKQESKTKSCKSKNQRCEGQTIKISCRYDLQGLWACSRQACAAQELRRHRFRPQPRRSQLFVGPRLFAGQTFFPFLLFYWAYFKSRLFDIALAEESDWLGLALELSVLWRSSVFQNSFCFGFTNRVDKFIRTKKKHC